MSAPWLDGPPLSSTPEMDRQWNAWRNGKASKPGGYEEATRTSDRFGIGISPGWQGYFSDAGSRERAMQAQAFAQNQALQQYQAQIGLPAAQPTSAPPPAVEDPDPLPRKRELDLEPAEEVRQPTIKAREIEL